MTYLGALFSVLFVFGYLIHTYIPRNTKTFTLSKIKSIPKSFQSKETKRKVQLEPIRETLIGSAFQQILKDFIRSQLSTNIHSPTILRLLATQNSSDNSSIIDAKVQEFTALFMNLFLSVKCQTISDDIASTSLVLIQKFVDDYKEIRGEYELNDSANENADDYEHRHLDDFNDFSVVNVDNEDESIKWSVDLDKMHQQIYFRLKYAGILHSGVGNGKDGELALIRKWTTVIMNMMEKNGMPMTPSKTLGILFREWFVCTIGWPLLNRITTPDFLNSYIISVANDRIKIQKTVKAFRARLDFDYEHFPPAFLIYEYQQHKFTMAEKLRYIEVIARYLKKATSLIDIEAVKYELLFEINSKNILISIYS
jgi:hypothetical protein